MSLRDYLKNVERKHIQLWFEFRDGFEVCIRPLTQREFRALVNKCKRFRYNRRTHMREEVVDDDALREKIVRECVLDWKGLTPNKLRQWIPGIDIEPHDQEIPYNPEDALALMDHLFGFENFIVNAITRSYEIIDEFEGEATQNLSSMSDGG